MKKIGILFGKESSFPYALIERINAKKIPNIVAEIVTVDKVAQGDPTEYAVIIDRISQDVPFYRAYLKNAAICGTAVINNPFWWSADEKFFNNALALKIGVPVPNTVILPSKNRPDDTSEMSFRNLKHPLSWDAIFEYIGFPAYMKPHSGGGWKSVYKLHSKEEFFEKYAETGQLVMMLQSEVLFDEYFRCYCLGGNRVHIMQYDPRNPHEARYVRNGAPVSKELLAKVEDYTLKLNRVLGYDFNTVEFGVQNGIPYAIDFCNPAPDADVASVGEDNFEWVVENAAMMAIERAKIHREGQNNLTWGTFVKNAIAGYAPNIPTPVWGNISREVREIADTPKLVMPSLTSEVSRTMPTSNRNAKETVAVKDDLKKIEGIGPKIEEVLNSAGIINFSQLCNTPQQRLQEILDAAGKHFIMHDPTSWTLQANLANQGDWDALKQLQSQLIVGKSK